MLSLIFTKRLHMIILRSLGLMGIVFGISWVRCSNVWSLEWEIYSSQISFMKHGEETWWGEQFFTRSFHHISHSLYFFESFYFPLIYLHSIKGISWQVVAYFFYKNLAFTFTQFWFTLYIGFSSQHFSDDWF